MQDINDNFSLPFKIQIGFKNLLKFYEAQLATATGFNLEKAEQITAIIKENPKLENGFSTIQHLKEHQADITFLLQDFFNPISAKNEIKMATTIFNNNVFCASQRFKSILNEAGDSYKLNIINLPKDSEYIISCAIILNSYYNYDINFKRPLYYKIPDENGLIKTYKILYNADFVSIYKYDNAPLINEKDFEHLLNNFDNIDLWKSKFPVNSYQFNGFVIANMFDVTNDQAISNIKATLIATNSQEKELFISDFQDIFRTLLNAPDLSVGFSLYNNEDATLVKVYDATIGSFLLQKENSKKCQSIFCDYSFKSLIKDHNYYSVSDIDDAFSKSNGSSPQIITLHKQGVKSAVFAPIVDNNKLLGVLELVSKKPYELHSFKANKLEDVMPYIRLAVKRSQNEELNLIQAIIQKECTAIHPSVQWKFEQSARQYMIDIQNEGDKAVFNRIDFKNVYPLFGQADIVNSSKTRNEATGKDLMLQLMLAEQIIEAVLEVENLSVFKQLDFQIKKYKDALAEELQVSTEQEIVIFLQNDLEPVFKLEAEKDKHIKKEVSNYFSKLNDDLKVIYYYRKSFDDTVMAINEDISSLLDLKQIKAQNQYPHFFERYKTDGVEHNMYIGEAITKENSFNMLYLYNIRLWQLQAMCEAEILVNANKDKYPIDLQIASMLLVFNQPLSVNFRFDEKHFDVDGTYNARYEVVKKRIDKVHVLDTDERATKAGKITIMYSQNTDAEEYIKYINYLQSKSLLLDDLEYLELEHLQGVQGLKALRVGVNYELDKIDNYFSYQDMLKTLS